MQKADFSSGSTPVTNNKIINTFISQPDFPFLISFPRTGSHWLRMLMELYFEKPLLTRIFYFPKSKDFLGYHHHDTKLEIQRDNVIYLWRDPIPTIFSQIIYRDEDWNDKKNVKYWSIQYAKHLKKWLLREDFTKDKTIIKYENLKINLTNEFKKITEHFESSLNINNLTSVSSLVSKNEVSKKTRHDIAVINKYPYYEAARQQFYVNFRDRIIDSMLKEDKNLHEYIDENANNDK